MSNSINDSLRKASDAIHDVIINYVEFMETIGNTIVCCRENVEINKRKLLETKKELF